jgi:predicted TIM-barrel fold metal-dependent hydrolase
MKTRDMDENLFSDTHTARESCQETNVKMPVIDFHSHNFPDSIASYAISSMSRKTEGVLWPVGNGTMQNHISHMKLSGVTKAVLCQIATKPSQWEPIFRRSIDIIEGACGEDARNMIIPFASIHPLDDKFAEHLELIAKSGIKGVKFHPYYQDFSIADERYFPIFKKIADLGLVVQCHTGGDVCWSEIDGFCSPREIVKLVKNIRSLKFVAAHLGGCYKQESHATDQVLECGVYVDTSVLASTWHKDEEMRILRSWPKDKILFASDFPWVHYPEAISHIKSIREKDDWKYLFYLNALRLLGE